MKKLPLYTILLKFYNRDVMRYVGTQWKNSGFLLLLALSFYASLFVGTSLANATKDTYELTYRPALKLLPPIACENNIFSLEQEEPLKIFHPVTKEPIFYIDTLSDDANKDAQDFPFVITKKYISFDSYPVLIEAKDIKAAIDNSKELNITEFSGPSINKFFDNSSKLLTPAFIVTYTLLSFFSEALKILMIAILVLLIFSKRQKKQKFKDVTRLAILCYIPVLIINSICQAQFVVPGLITTVAITFVHISLLMKAISIRDLTEEQYEELQKLP